MDIEQLVKIHHESKDLDYKGPMDWSVLTKAEKCEIVKDVIAFANTGGGYIVIGVQETHTGFENVGLNTNEMGSFDTTSFNQFVHIYAEPPINCTLHKVTVDDKSYVIIKIPEFSETPHICKQELTSVLNRSYIYVRTDNNNSAPLNTSADFRYLIEKAVRQKQDLLLESFRSILTGSQQSQISETAQSKFLAELAAVRRSADSQFYYIDEFGSYQDKAGIKEFWSFPDQYDKDLLDLASLKRLARNASTSYRGWPFIFSSRDTEKAPYADEDGLCMKYKFTDFLDNRRSDYWKYNSSAFFYKRSMMWEDDYAKNNNLNSFLEVHELVSGVAEALKAITTLYDGILHPSDMLNIGVNLSGLLNRELRMVPDSAVGFSQQYISRHNSFKFERVNSLGDWRAGIEDHCVEICTYFFERFNWDRPNTELIRNDVRKLFTSIPT